MNIKFLGHSAVLLEDGKYKLLIDPFLTGNPVYKKDETDTLNITHIFVTHAHGDHLGDTIKIAKENNSTIITNAELSNILWKKDQTLKLHPMHIGGTYSFEFGRVKMTPALHGSGFNDNGNMMEAGNPCGFVIDIGDKRIYHAGDTGLTMDMQLLEKEHINIAFLPIGGNYTMDYIDAARAVQFIQPELVIPMHYNTFPLINADPLEFKKLVPNTKVKILQAGESL